MNNFKTLILTAFWGRAEISQLYWMGIERLRKRFDIQTASIVSDQTNKDMAMLHGTDYLIELPNRPMGRKMNNSVDQLSEIKFDFLMQLGSDNLITDKGMETNLKYMEKYKFFGHTNLIMVDSKSKESKLKKYGNVFGAGRCIAKELVYKCMPIWTDDRERGLDVNSEISIEEKAGVVSLPINDEEIIDVKGDENIWKYDYFEGEKFDYKSKCTKTEYNYIISL